MSKLSEAIVNSIHDLFDEPDFGFAGEPEITVRKTDRGAFFTLYATDNNGERTVVIERVAIDVITTN